MAVAQGADKELLKREFTGTVTNLQSTYGLVDHSVYFELAVVRGQKPNIGSEVCVHAHRQDVSKGWIATSVALANQETEWSAGGFQSETCNKVVIGQVTEAHRLTGTVDKKYHFYKQALPDGYCPVRGDWLRCHLHGSDDNWSVEKVEPTRTRTYEGRITSTRNPSMIDHDIMFLRSACIHSYRPQEGDNVEGEAIEHDGRSTEWRALHVRPATAKGAGLFRVNSALLKAVRACILACRPSTTSASTSVSMPDKYDLGVVEVGGCSRHPVCVRNIGSSNLSLYTVVAVWPDPMLDIAALPAELCLLPGQEGSVEVMLTARYRGTFEQILVFDFGESCISRPLSYQVLEAGEAMLAPSAPFQKPARRSDLGPRESREGRVVVPGRRVKRGIEMKYLPCKLKMYDVPNSIRQCCYDGGDVTEVAPELGHDLSSANYVQRFDALLFLEEVQNEMEMQQFDMQSVRFAIRGPYLALDVPGIAEGRPSLLLGDAVSATVAGERGARGAIYEGYIHQIVINPDQQCILLKFSDQFHNTFSDSDYDITFSIGRTPFRRCHLAVEVAAEVCQEVLFPTSLASKLPIASITPKALINKQLNARQLSAVNRILSGQARPCPYLLFGPPGTGKTMTVVETILQVFRCLPSSRILACAPSNSASDLLAQRLYASGMVTPADMIRFNAYQRRTPTPEELVPFSKNIEEVHEAVRYRIVISTCVTAGMLYSQGLQLGHFSHVFIDEAGQATEPECMIALGLAANQSGAAMSILAGDPYQLGPVLQSPLASDYGLHVSLLERMIERPMYQRDETKFSDHGCYDPLLVTKLIQNYRCHPSILELFSRIFYHNELEPCADLQERNRFCGWSELPNPSFPLIFHGLEGNDMREGTSPSWFNSAEIVQTADYLKSLFKSPDLGLRMDEVGVITPYRKQVEKMRQFLGTVSLEDVKVGSVEEFQGQERPVIVISTVRSQESLLAFDHKHQIGFLSNPKRFNVSISRAKSLMIIVGNPHILVQDPFWRLLLVYCARNGAYRGCSPPSLDADGSLFADTEE
eukprot:scpid9001/ scgid29262/ Putative helicase Mov10l1; Cardiac helicase activated by MEF2 protein; Cardiac-specific RNA helicase; Moloney leukemia virus 10-like protein 1